MSRVEAVERGWEERGSANVYNGRLWSGGRTCDGDGGGGGGGGGDGGGKQKRKQIICV